MSQLDGSDVAKIADLSMLLMEPHELEALRKELNTILQTFDQLDALLQASSGAEVVEATAGLAVSQLVDQGAAGNSSRPDVVKPLLCSEDDLRRVFPQSRQGHLVVPQVIEREDS